MITTFGAPAGAPVRCGHEGVDSSRVRPMREPSFVCSLRSWVTCVSSWRMVRGGLRNTIVAATPGACPGRASESRKRQRHRPGSERAGNTRLCNMQRKASSRGAMKGTVTNASHGPAASGLRSPTSRPSSLDATDVPQESSMSPWIAAKSPKPGVLAMTFGLLSFAAGALAAEPSATVIEYHNARLNHYFLTADAAEAAMLDAGVLVAGWKRTGV